MSSTVQSRVHDRRRGARVLAELSRDRRGPRLREVRGTRGDRDGDHAFMIVVEVTDEKRNGDGVTFGDGLHRPFDLLLEEPDDLVVLAGESFGPLQPVATGHGIAKDGAARDRRPWAGCRYGS